MNKKKIQLALLIIFPPIIFCLIGVLGINLIFWVSNTGLLGQKISQNIDGFADISGVYFLIMIIVGIYTFISSLISWIILIPSLKKLNFRIKLKKVLLLSFLIVPIAMVMCVSALYIISFVIGSLYN